MSSKLLLFDVDGTLTPARKVIESDMLTCLQNLYKIQNVDIGFVGGSDLKKQVEQLHEENFYLFKWRFSENGLLGFNNNECIHKRSFVEALGETHFKRLINIILFVLSSIDCPVKRGTFIEYRNGMLNISPVGRACSQEEREEFENYDSEHNVRQCMIRLIQDKWKTYMVDKKLNLPDLKFSIGGQISVDIFPEGWDKTYCLQFVENKYDEIHFFGDKTDKGGNDYEIYNDSRVIAHKVENYQHTIELLNKLFMS
jgi:phosphomannomutase